MTDDIDTSRENVERTICNPIISMVADGRRVTESQWGDMIDLARALRDEVDRLEATRGVKVKPLEFSEYSMTGGWLDGYEIRLRALTRSQNYFINRRLSDDKFIVSLKVIGGEFSVHDDIESAIYSANQENERRILSALEPDHSEWNAALEAAVCAMDLGAHIMSHHGTSAGQRAYQNAASQIRALKRCTHPNLEASTCGFESCPDCGARLEED